MSFINAISTRVAQLFNNDAAMTGATAVVQDFTERQNLSLEGKEIDAQWYEAERLTESGVFNELAVANVKFDLGQYGEYNVTLDMENELQEFMDVLNLDVEDLEWLTDQGATIPMIRDGGEWRIRWEDVRDYDLYQEDEGHPQLPPEEEREAEKVPEEEETEETKEDDVPVDEDTSEEDSEDDNTEEETDSEGDDEDKEAEE